MHENELIKFWIVMLTYIQILANAQFKGFTLYSVVSAQLNSAAMKLCCRTLHIE
jgi:hypothetical protein